MPTDSRDIRISPGVRIGRPGTFFLIAGPCVIESRDRTFRLARRLKSICAKLDVPFIFKASFDKANRSSIRSYRGPGLDRGLEILAEIKAELDIPVLSDVHETAQVAKAAEVLDVIQIPALLCRQTDLLLAAARTQKPVNVKKGQFLSPYDMKNAVEKIESQGNRKIILTERGTMLGYNNLVVDIRSIPIMKRWGYPVVIDASHSVQKPGGRGSSSGGDREFIPAIARAATSAGADGVFLEVHDEPKAALSDKENALDIKDLKDLLESLLRLTKAV
ncbi:MAG: 3-deoxy-8-phosphooctulonate synthase [Candidatus Aminicenantes bacterium]|nr:3-deoxy-8-phosphooctulonate synthase [Candidatus Aminicenantes bacterium]